MTAEWIRSGLDIVLIILVGAGLVQATRLIWHLASLRAGRAEMERFVREFNSTVVRAEAGIKGLKMAARESGDDLEKLVEKSLMVRDELQFIVESADQLAERLSKAATTATGMNRPDMKPPEMKSSAPVSAAAPATTPITATAPSVVEVKSTAEPQKSAPVTPLAARREPELKPASRAEKELMQALKKLN